MLEEIQQDTPCYSYVQWFKQPRHGNWHPVACPLSNVWKSLSFITKYQAQCVVCPSSCKTIWTWSHSSHFYFCWIHSSSWTGIYGIYGIVGCCWEGYLMFWFSCIKLHLMSINKLLQQVPVSCGNQYPKTGPSWCPHSFLIKGVTAAWQQKYPILETWTHRVQCDNLLVAPGALCHVIMEAKRKNQSEMIQTNSLLLRECHADLSS